jgi:hypothetical protein
MRDEGAGLSRMGLRYRVNRGIILWTGPIAAC